MKIGLAKIPFRELAAYRMVLAFITLIPFGVMAWSKISYRHWKYLAIVGICGHGAPAFLFAYAQQHINSSLAGMLNSLVPLFTLLLGMLLFGMKAKQRHFIGVIIGFAGAIFLLFRADIEFNASTVYGLYIVLATICYATSVNTIKKHLHDVSSAVITSASLLVVGPLCGIYLFTFTEFPSRISMDPEFMKSLMAVSALAVFGTGMAIIIFNMLIKRVSALYASSVTYLIPVIAILWGVADGESITTLQFLGMGGILTGVYLIQR